MAPTKRPISRGCGDRRQLHDDEDGEGKRREDASGAAFKVAAVGDEGVTVWLSDLCELCGLGSGVLRGVDGLREHERWTRDSGKRFGVLQA